MLTFPKHNRYDYSVIDERPDYVLAGRKAARLLFDDQYRGLCLSQRDRLGFRQERRTPAAAQLLLARLRQSGRHLAHVRPVREPQLAGRRARQFSCSTTISGDGANAAAPAATRSSAMAAPTPSGRASCGARRARLIVATPESSARGRPPPKGWIGPGSRRARDARPPAEAGYPTSWTGASTTSRSVSARSGPILAVPYPEELNDIPAIVASQGPRSTSPT